MTPRQSRSQSPGAGVRWAQAQCVTPHHSLTLTPTLAPAEDPGSDPRVAPAPAQPSLLLRQTITHSTHTIQLVADFGPAGDRENILLIVNLFSQRDFK